LLAVEEKFIQMTQIQNFQHELPDNQQQPPSPRRNP
jgi:hypothetical protein